MYKFLIKEIKIFGYHGVYDEEIKNGQNFYITISYKNILNKKSTIKLENTIDYSEVVKIVSKRFNFRRYNLMENLSRDIHSDIKNNFNVKDLSVEIKKHNPAVGNDVKYISTIYNG